MKIGILTYHRSNNYGALLQAIALRKVLADMGHDVYFIDYWPAYHKHLYDIFSFESLKQKSFKNKIRYIGGVIRKYRWIKARIQNFEDFRSIYIYPYLSSMDDMYDMVICGSDQIWRKQREIHVYNPVYFGKNDIKALRQISYAASMGVITKDENDKHVLKDYLSHLDSISVRENDLKELVEELGYDCEQSLDPTLLLNKEQWSSLINITPANSEKYVLYYKLLGNSFDEQLIKKFAKEHNLKLITLYGGAKKETENNITTASPRGMLSLINGAEFVFTSSYHGVVFSILFHKSFYAAFSKNSGRAASLLSELNLSNRLLEPMSHIPQNECAIDFAKVDEIIKNKRRPSIEYLEKIVKLKNV